MQKTDIIPYILFLGITGIIIANVFHACQEQKYTTGYKNDTLIKVNIVERPVYIKDTVKIKSVMWKYKDTTIFVEEDLPCNDTSFIAQADSVLLPSGDTLNMAFSYADRRGNFSLVFKPRPDSIITKTILYPVLTDEPYPYGAIIGTFGLGILIGVAAALSK